MLTNGSLIANFIYTCLLPILISCQLEHLADFFHALFST